MEKDPIRTDARKARRERTLGEDAVCILCGQSNPSALRSVKRSLLEGHHLVGRANDPDLTVPLCLNCHARLSEDQRVHGTDLQHGRPRNGLEVVRTILQELARFFHTLGDSLAGWAERLNAVIEALDRAFPGWRSLSEVQWI